MIRSQFLTQYIDFSCESILGNIGMIHNVGLIANVLQRVLRRVYAGFALYHRLHLGYKTDKKYLQLLRALFADSPFSNRLYFSLTYIVFLLSLIHI